MQLRYSISAPSVAEVNKRSPKRSPPWKSIEAPPVVCIHAAHKTLRCVTNVVIHRNHETAALDVGARPAKLSKEGKRLELSDVGLYTDTAEQ